jgi:putative ABC transport system permease protein
MSAQRLVAGTALPGSDPDAVIVGRGLAASMNVKPGDYLTLMTTTSGGALNAVDVRVAGIFMSGVKEYDDRAIKMPIVAAQRLLQTDRIEKLLVFLHETEQTATVERELAASFSRNGWALEMKRWSDLAPFYHQVVLLYNGIFGFLGLILFGVVVFSVANTITMSVFERTREIGTMMAIGTTRSQVGRLFLLEGLLIGVLGALAGLTCGALLAFVINNGNVMLPPPPGYTVGYRLQILLQRDVLTVAFVVSLLTATLSSIAPAWRASRLKVVDALGHI